MDIQQLDPLVSFYFHASLAPSTTRSYDSAKRRYLQFCSTKNITSLPVTEQNLCSYVAHVAKSGLSHQTIKCYLSAIRHLQIELGGGDPHISTMPVLEHVLRGIKKEHSKKSPMSKTRLPMTPNILLKLRAIWEEEAHAFDHIMIWAACCTCYFGFLRSGEICTPSDASYDPATHLSITDIAVNSHTNTSSIAVRIKASKTDPFRQGVTIYLGATDSKLCPVKAILAYIAVRGHHQGPLFLFSDKKVLTRERFVDSVRSALCKAGLNPDLYSGHSFRIGAATVAHEKGLDDSTIMTLGRWKSNAYQRYVRIPRENLAKVSHHIASPVISTEIQTFHPIMDN